ncbi:MAG: phosphotransferase [Lachnospiraceae bacterium]|nr:phosphotransferase [Lachnospiraceae bacterium]
MLHLDKSNITDYLKKTMPGMDFSKPLSIHEIGEGTREEDGDGFLNFIFLVSDGRNKVVLKQGQEHGRVGHAQTFDLPADRNRLEYDSLKIRKAIVPELVPGIFFYDAKNCIMAMEDVSHLKIMRFQLNKNVIYPKFPYQVAEYMAKTHFYTSEFYLDTKVFRELTKHFMNHKMRSVFDTDAFITEDLAKGKNFGIPVNSEYMPFVKKIILDPKVIKERMRMRQLYVSRGETFVHADLHTSNVLLDQSEMKVIDMEYTFCGPLAYDMGYLLVNFVSQFICAVFREFKSEGERKTFREYCLDTICKCVNEYCRIFKECWEKDAKSLYRNVDGLLDDIIGEYLQDMIGFAATNTFSRSAGPFMLPEIAEVADEGDRAKVVILSMIFARASILKRRQYRTVEDWVDELSQVDELFHLYNGV